MNVYQFQISEASGEKKLFMSSEIGTDRLCDLVVRVSGYRSRGPGFDSRRHQIFWEVVGLERGPLSLVSTIEELLERNSSGSGLENQEYGCGDPLRWPRDTLYQLELALTSSAGCGRSVGIVLLLTKATGFLNWHLEINVLCVAFIQEPSRYSSVMSDDK
jgi:hypothetical protein